MRRLGLALLLGVMVGVMVVAPHAAFAKKHTSKHGRSAKAHKAKRARHAREVEPKAAAGDELATAVTEKRAVERPTLTAAAPAPAVQESNAPLTMSNQDLDTEVPGAKHKK